MARLLQLLRFRPRTALPAVTALRMERRRNSFHRVQSWHHTWYVTTGASQLDTTRFMLHVCSPSLWLCCEVSSVHSGAAPSHAMDPANANTFHGAVGDGRAAFGSMRGKMPQANKAQLSSVASLWALPGGGSDACAPAVDLAALMQLTAWIKALGELIRMQDEKDSRLVDLWARAVSVLDAWAQRWYDEQAIHSVRT